MYVGAEEYAYEETMLQERFAKACTIAGTQKLHSFKPVSLNSLEVAEYSVCTVPENVSLILKHVCLNFESSLFSGDCDCSKSS